MPTSSLQIYHLEPQQNFTEPGIVGVEWEDKFHPRSAEAMDLHASLACRF